MKIQTNAKKTDEGWVDEIGLVAPFKPGEGPRRYPADDFPTGPAEGEQLPDVVAADQFGNLVDLHQARNGRPAVVAFYRSAVW